MRELVALGGSVGMRAGRQVNQPYFEAVVLSPQAETGTRLAYRNIPREYSG